MAIWRLRPASPELLESSAPNWQFLLIFFLRPRFQPPKEDGTSQGWTIQLQASHSINVYLPSFCLVFGDSVMTCGMTNLSGDSASPQKYILISGMGLPAGPKLACWSSLSALPCPQHNILSLIICVRHCSRRWGYSVNKSTAPLWS